MGIWVGSYMPFQMYKKAVEKLSFWDQSLVTPEALNPKDFLVDIDRLFWEHEQTGDDLIWAATPLIGFPWMEAIVGCSIRACSDSFWAEPYIQTWEQINNISFSSKNKWFQKILEFKEVFIEHSRGRYPVATSPSPMRGPGDMMGASLGQERLCLELYDNPGMVKKLASIYTDIWIQVNKIQIKKTPKFLNGYVVAYYNIWTPDFCQYDQEDALDYFSPHFFEEVLLEQHRRIYNSFPYPLFHLHPHSLYCLPNLYKIESLRIIEINKDLYGPSISELLPTLKRVQKHKPLLIWGDLARDEIRQLLSELSPRGLCIYPVVKTVEEGRTLLKKIRKGKI